MSSLPAFFETLSLVDVGLATNWPNQVRLILSVVHNPMSIIARVTCGATRILLLQSTDYRIVFFLIVFLAGVPFMRHLTCRFSKYYEQVRCFFHVRRVCNLWYIRESRFSPAILPMYQAFIMPFLTHLEYCWCRSLCPSSMTTLNSPNNEYSAGYAILL